MCWNWTCESLSLHLRLRWCLSLVPAHLFLGPLVRVRLLPVGVHVGFGIERRSAERAVVQNLSGVRRPVLFQRYRILEALLAELALVLFRAVHLSLVRFQSELVRRLFIANVTNENFVRLGVLGDDVFLEGGLVLEYHVTYFTCDTRVFRHAQMLSNVIIEALLGFELTSTGVANEFSLVAVHVDHVGTERSLSGENFVAFRALEH